MCTAYKRFTTSVTSLCCLEKNSVKLWFPFSISLINYSLQLKVVMFSIKTKNSLEMRKDTFYFLCSNPPIPVKMALKLNEFRKV